MRITCKEHKDNKNRRNLEEHKITIGMGLGCGEKTHKEGSYSMYMIIRARKQNTPVGNQDVRNTTHRKEKNNTYFNSW